MRLEPLLMLGLLACGGGDDADPVAPSQKLRVMPKPGVVWGRDLAAGLGLATWDLCRELGVEDCIEEAHRITLGGVEPERLGIDRPVADALVSAPIAVDRVASAACGERYARDEAGSPVVFGPVLDRDDAGAREQVASVLIQRLLGRHPQEAEVEALLGLHEALEPVSTDLRRDWSVGACVVVATSTEALFY